MKLYTGEQKQLSEIEVRKKNFDIHIRVPLESK